MSITYIQAETALAQAQARVLLDVRSPAEYADSHIPGAINLPLFSNAERAEIGTLYKQDSPESAFLRGLEVVGPKMRALVEQAQALAPGRQVCLHCWRGGQRSGSLAWLLDLSGFEVQVIEGGYKAYRRWVQAQFEQAPGTFLIVGGPTGAGKTEILHALQAAGEQVIDLEGLAHHKGSSFGGLGEAPQPSVAQFENELWAKWQACDVQRRIWLENESRSIGRIYLPDAFWDRMEAAPLFDLEVPLEGRLNRLVADYASYSKADLQAAFQRIGKRLGGLRLQAALEAVEAADYREAARIALAYYDKAYLHHTTRQQDHKRIIPLKQKEDHPAATAAALIAFANENTL